MTQRQLRRLLKRDFQMSNLGLSHETLEDIASISVGEGRLQLLSNILEAYKATLINWESLRDKKWAIYPRGLGTS